MPSNIAKGAVVEVDQLTIGKNSVISSGCVIRGKHIEIGADVFIGPNCQIGGWNRPKCDRLIIGDDSFLANDINIAAPIVEIGDYVKIQRFSGLFGERPCAIGHNTWVGQGSILNSTGFLFIGNNVGIGIYSYIWTHVAHGELLEGCTMFSHDPTILEDDAWLVGGNIVVNPGIRLAKRSCVLPGSVVTKNTVEGHAYAGVPARDMNDHLVPYQPVDLSEKFKRMKAFIQEFADFRRAEGDPVSIAPDGTFLIGKLCSISFIERPVRLPDFEKGVTPIIFTAEKLDSVPSEASLFNLATKTYSKRRNLAERTLIKFLKARARFVPAKQPRIGEKLLAEYADSCPNPK